jgi:hypothetical protein
MLDANTVIEEGCNDWVPMHKVEARRVVYLLDNVSQISQKAGIMQTECDAPLAVQRTPYQRAMPIRANQTIGALPQMLPRTLTVFSNT